MDKRFVCDETNMTFKAWLQVWKSFCKERDIQVEFLRKQAQSLEDRHTQMWDELFNALQKEDLIAGSLKKEGTGMSYTEEPPHQLFIKTGGSDEGVPDLIKALMRGMKKD